MLRTALPLRIRAGFAPIGSRLVQWTPPQTSIPAVKRGFADRYRQDGNTKPTIFDSEASVLPGSESKTAVSATPPPPGPVYPGIPRSPLMNSDVTAPPAKMPLTPPSPPSPKAQISTPTTIPPAAGRPVISTLPPPPPPPPRRKTRRFRNFLVYLTLLIGLGYGGGVWYSLISDNFHDFFTEYVPGGEETVHFFEEREYRKRFPNAARAISRSTPVDQGHKVTIPSKSGLSWKVASSEPGASDKEAKGPHMSALDKNPPKVKADAGQQSRSTVTAAKKDTTIEKVKEEAAPTIEKPLVIEELIPETVTPPVASPEAPLVTEQGLLQPDRKKPVEKAEQKKMPEVNEPSVYIPMGLIDPLAIKNADEPLVQNLVKILNDIITVVNADNSTGKFTSTITKAKSELAGVGQKILNLKAAERSAADQKVKATETEFDNAAKELVRRLEDEMRNQEARWRDEFESERDKISETYQERLKMEVQRTQEVADQRARNQLLEQSVAMKKDFLTNVKDRVETERNGRLAKLSELSTSVSELEKLTSEWNSVIDANLKTQHLQVAVEAVRSSLERTDRPRPFLKELAALKEIADDDPVVNSAIASINPIAYQRGVPTPAQLIDRFRRVAIEVRKASLLPEDAGVASHAASYVLSKVLFKKQGRAVGDDVESVLTRTESLLEEGKLDDAAREMNALTGWAKTLSGDWLAEVRRVLEVRQAVEVIAAEARLQSLKVD